MNRTGFPERKSLTLLWKILLLSFRRERNYYGVSCYVKVFLWMKARCRPTKGFSCYPYFNVEASAGFNHGLMPFLINFFFQFSVVVSSIRTEDNVWVFSCSNSIWRFSTFRMYQSFQSAVPGLLWKVRKFRWYYMVDIDVSLTNGNSNEFEILFIKFSVSTTRDCNFQITFYLLYALWLSWRIWLLPVVEILRKHGF